MSAYSARSLTVFALQLVSMLACLPKTGAAAGTIAQASSMSAVNPPPLRTMGVRAWVKTRSGWVEAPAQIDERDANDDYVLEHGMPFTANGGDNIFNKNDELVIAFPQEVTSFSDADAAKKMTDLGRRPGMQDFKGWIVKFEAASPASHRPNQLMALVTQSPWEIMPSDFPVKYRAGTVSTPAYRYTFNRTSAAAIGKLELPQRGMDNQNSQEFRVINQSGSFAVWLRPAWGFPVIHQSDRDISSSIESWRSGPVRSIVAVGGKYSALWSTVKAHLFSELVFYRDRFQIPSVIDVPFSPKMLLGSGSGFAYGLELDGPAPPKILRTGEETDGEGGIEVEHPSGLKLRAKVDPKLASEGILPRVWSLNEDSTGHKKIRENSHTAVPGRVKEWLRQAGANIGFFVDISSMAKGRYDFALDLESQGEANQPHTDFLICKSVWAPVEPSKSTRTAAPVPKQE